MGPISGKPRQEPTTEADSWCVMLSAPCASHLVTNLKLLVKDKTEGANRCLNSVQDLCHTCETFKRGVQIVLRTFCPTLLWKTEKFLLAHNPLTRGKNLLVQANRVTG